MNKYVPYLVALILFILAAVRPAFDWLGSSDGIVEALIVAGLAFIALQLSVAETKLSNSERAIQAANDKMRTGTDHIKELNDQLHYSTANLDDSIKKVDEMTEKALEIVKLTTKVVGNVPEFTDIARGLHDDDVVHIGQTVANAFHDYGQAWTELAKSLQIPQNRIAIYAWVKFIETYLKESRPNSENKRIRTSSGVYTRIIVSCCDELLRLYPDRDSHKVTLFLVTAMLPDEFFNWPQAELLNDNVYLEYIPHTWDGSESYFSQIEEMKKDVRVRRCILVRSGDRIEAASGLSSLRSFDDLQEILDLWIRDWPTTYEELKTAQMNHLFGRITKRGTIAEYEDGVKFRKIKEFRFYPVGKREEFRESLLMPGSRLLDLFVEKLHSSEKDALYYTVPPIDEDIRQALFSNSELMPELAMFKVESTEQQDQRSEWIFGIIGYLRPFTESMDIQFLVGSNMDQIMRDTLRKLERQSDELGKLRAQRRDNS